MIRVAIEEQFTITVALIDEDTGQNAIGETVNYDILDADDDSLSPPMAGVLPESTTNSGIYRKVIGDGITEAGNYTIYATCTGFTTNAEELIVNEENVYDVIKQTQNYNTSVEDVLRTGGPTASQIARNVPEGKTDYLITRIKADDAVDWTSPVTSGTIFAWYKTDSDELPYKMSGPI